MPVGRAVGIELEEGEEVLNGIPVAGFASEESKDALGGDGDEEEIFMEVIHAVERSWAHACAGAANEKRQGCMEIGKLGI